MTSIGYALSSEEHMPNDLVRYAKMAEQAGFPYALISDHFHPWVDQQGQSPFVWGVIGGIAQVTENLRLGTGVTASILRIHPAIIAQAAATAAAMMPGRFFLGVGSGENLNEHILGDHWPPIEVRLEMLEEYVEFIRFLWEGENVSRWGTYYTVENARIYTLPDELPPIMVAAGGKLAGDVAGRIGDGLIATSPESETVESFREAGGEGKPMYGQLTVCWGEDEAQARRMSHKWWPNTALPGFLNADLIAPPHFELAVKLVSEEDVAEKIICGPDKRRHLDGIQEFVEAGFEYVYVHQVGPDQEGFLDFYQKEILPEFA